MVLLAGTTSRADAPRGVTITLQNASGKVLASETDPQGMLLNYQTAYQKGDMVVIAGPNGAKYFFVQIDSAVFGVKSEVTY